jgi:hypothetical protein
MPSQQMFLGLGGKAAPTDIASLHEVSPTASTTVSVNLNQDFACTYSQPSSSGWGDFPYTTFTGMLISGFWSTTEDNKGIWKTSANNTYDQPTGLTLPSSASTSTSSWPTSWPISQSIGTNATTPTNGVYAGNHTNATRTTTVLNYTFSSGLGSALGFVLQGYGNYGNGYGAFHTTPLVKITINSITRLYGAKGHIHVNNTTCYGTGRGGFVVYPMNYTKDDWGDMTWALISGTQLASDYFEY